MQGSLEEDLAALRKLRDRIERSVLERWRSNLGGALGSQAGFRTRGDAKKGGSVFGFTESVRRSSVS